MRIIIIEDAVTQVCRGLNGFMNFIELYRQVLSNEKGSIEVIPVIFTTAKLYASDVNIGNANIIDGKIDLASVRVEQKPWIWYRYHQSLSLTHEVERPGSYGDLDEIINQEYARTVAIVNASGIEEFLTTEWI